VTLVDIDVAAVPVADLPVLLGELGRLQGEVLARLNAPSAPLAPKRLLTDKEAAQISGMSARWIRKTTRGLKFRHDLSRKSVRLAEDGFRAWLVRRAR
jgi:hypothetical protein